MDCFSDDGGDNFVPHRDYKHFERTYETKRMRTLSPGACRRTVELKRMERESARKEERERRKEARSKKMYDKVMHSIYEEAAKTFQESGMCPRVVGMRFDIDIRNRLKCGGVIYTVLL